MQEKEVPGYPTVIEKRVRSKNRGGDDGGSALPPQRAPQGQNTKASGNNLG